MDAIIRENPNVDRTVVAFTGFDFIGGSFKTTPPPSSSYSKHWDERHVPANALVGEVFMKTAHQGGPGLAFGPPAIFGLGNSGGFEFYLQNRGEGAQPNSPP